jgi:hypothetical protein
MAMIEYEVQALPVREKMARLKALSSPPKTAA